MVSLMNNNHINGQNDVCMEVDGVPPAESSCDLNQKMISAKTEKDLKKSASLAVKALRTFVLSDNFKAAEDFVLSVKTLPESATNNDWARWFYYLGRIEALKGTDAKTYKVALKHFEVSLRKAPQESGTGFKQEVNKWIVLVKLLVGEIPERSLFRAPELCRVLDHYLRLTQAVRLGNLTDFEKTKKEFEARFVKDSTMTLVERIHQSVIRTAIRKISDTYSLIYIKDLAAKLQLSVEDAHDAVIKAIKEGMVRAQLVCDDAQGRYVKFGQYDDCYRGTEPQKEFDGRVKELLELYDQSMKALRYPDKRNPEVETIEEQRKREQLVLEMAAAEEEDDDF